MNASASATLPPPTAARVAPNLRHAFGGIWRLTLRRFLLPGHWLSLLGLCAALVVLSLPPQNHRDPQHAVMAWIVMFYLTFVTPLMTFISAGGAIRDEMKAGNVDYMFTRPVPRPAFIGFKFVSHLICAQLDYLVSFAVVLGIAAHAQVPELRAAVPALLGAQLLVVTAFSAFGFMCGVITSRFIIVGLAYGVIVEVGVGQIPTQINKISMTHQVQGMLQPLLKTAASVAPATPPVPETSVGATITLLLGFTVIALFVAGAIFSFLELSGPNES